jgi:hypothetical protein
MLVTMRTPIANTQLKSRVIEKLHEANDRTASSNKLCEQCESALPTASAPLELDELARTEKLL